MAGSSYGTIFRVTTWGESHGKGIGAVVDGCPAGLLLSEEDIQHEAIVVLCQVPEIRNMPLLIYLLQLKSL